MTENRNILPAVIVAAIISDSTALAADSDFKAGLDAHTKMKYAESLRSLTKYIEGNPSDKKQLATAYWLRAHDKQMISKDWNGEVADCTQAIALDPNCSDAYHFRATALLMLGKNKEALDDIEKCLAFNPKDPTHLYGMRGLIRLTYKQDADGAIEDASKAIKNHPGYADAYGIRANAYEVKRKYDLALADWNKLMKLDPKRPNLARHRSVCMIELKQMSSSEFNRIQNSDQDKDGALSYQMAMALYHDGKFDRALSLLNETLKKNAKLYDAYLWRGLCHKQMGQSEQALRELNTFLVYRPKYLDGYYERASVLIAMHRIDAAFKDYKEAEGIDPNYVGTYEGRGSLYRKLGKYDNAMGEFRKGLALEPHSSAVHLAIAQMYSDQLQDEKAMAECKEVLLHDKHNPGALLLLQTLARENAMPSEVANTAAALGNGKSQTGYENWEAGQALQELRKYDQAIQQFDKTLERNPSEYGLHYHRAECLMKLGKFDAALKDWNAAILSRKSDFRAFRWRGECYLEMKQANDALSDFDKAISISPNNPELYQMRSRAYTILGKTELAKSDTEHWRQLREKSANELDN